MGTPLVTEERPKDHIVLIVDKDNQFGGLLASKIQTHATTVLVSEKKPEGTSFIHIPFTKRVPEIPVGTYSHIFLFSEDADEHELLLPLAEKAQADNAKFVYVLPYWLYKPEVTERLSNLCRQWVLVLIGDTFDTKQTTSHIGSIFYQAKTHKRIALPDLGLETLRPVETKDVVESLLRIGFGFEKEHLCFIFSKHPFTALSIVHALQKVDPLLRIDFINHQSSYPSPLLPAGMYLLETEYPTLKKIQDVYMGFEKEESRKGAKITPIVRKKTQRSGRWKLPSVSILVGLLFFLALPLIWTLSAAGLGGVLLENAKAQIEKGNFSQADTTATASISFFDWAGMGSNVVSVEAGVIGQGESVRVLSLQLHAMEELSQIVRAVAQAGENFQQVANGKTLTPQATFNTATIALKNALLTLQSMTYLPKSVEDELIPMQPLITLVGQTIDIAPSLFGIDKQKTYVLLFQDNTELRPGGGVIVAYAILKIDKGRVGDIQIHDIADADGQLKGHVEPPFAFKRYMNEDHWYLKDSSYAVDNLKNAQTEAFFIQQELGIQADGVIAMDLDFVKSLIGVVGKVDLPQYKQTIAPDNMVFLLESHSGAGSSVEDKKFLPVLLTALQKKLEGGHFSYETLGKQLLDGFAEKHLMVAFPDVTLQQLFTINNMSSALWDPRKNDGNTLNDFTALSEVNIGQNDANAFVTRSITQDMILNASGTVSGMLTMHYDNTNNGGFVGSDYKNYLRVVLPAGAQITNISLNNVPQSRFPAVIDPKVYQAKNFKTPKGIEIEHTQEGGKELYGFLVTVPTKAMLDVTVSYTLTQKLDLSQTSTTFDELLFKQPGTEDDPYTFTLSYPNFLTVIQGPNDMKKSNGKVVVSKQLATNEDYQFTFTNQ